MTIAEAIELLGIEDRRSYPKRRLEAHLALKLGIEALERISAQRKQIPPWTGVPLPSEAEE